MQICTSIYRYQYRICILYLIGLVHWLMEFHTTFLSHLVAVSFIGGGNGNTQRKLLTFCKQLTYFPTCIHVCSVWRHVIISSVLLSHLRPRHRWQPASDRARLHRDSNLGPSKWEASVNITGPRLFLPASPASWTHKFGKGLTILKSVHPGMQQIQRKFLHFTLEDSCLFVWDSLFCNFASPGDSWEKSGVIQIKYVW